MWTTFIPGIEEKVWRKAASIVAQEMSALLQSGGGALFEGIKEVLVELHQEGYELAFLSNCGRAYCNQHFRDIWHSSAFFLQPTALRNLILFLSGKSIKT